MAISIRFMKRLIKFLRLGVTLSLLIRVVYATAGTIEITTSDGKVQKYEYAPQPRTADAFPASEFQRVFDKAERGDAASQARIGWYYDKANGKVNEVHEAAKWFLRAAKQGHGMAQLWLAARYYEGQGVPQDHAEAYKWANLAAAQNAEAFTSWNIEGQKAKEVRDQFARNMTPQDIAEGGRRALAFMVRKEHSASPKPEAVEGTVTGTGFFVTADGYLVTCAHVVQGATHFHVKMSGGSISARLVTKDAGLDVALLKVNGTFLALPISPGSQIKLGDSVFTVGFPNTDLQGVAPKLTKGEISSLAGIHDNPRYFQISVPVQPGNSGGALMDERGNVVGVVAARLDDKVTYQASGALPQNVNYAVKGGLVYEFLSKMPGLSGKLIPPHTITDRDAANIAAERASVLVIAE